MNNTSSKNSKSTAKLSKVSAAAIAGGGGSGSGNSGGLKAGSPDMAQGLPVSSLMPPDHGHDPEPDSDMMSDQGSPVDPRQVGDEVIGRSLQ